MLAIFSAKSSSAGFSITARDYHLDPYGNDSNPGTRQLPFATLDGARDAVRKMKTASGLPKGGITIHVGEGIYPLAKPFTLTPEDSGTADAPIVYSGGDSRPVFTAGQRITVWRKVEAGIWAADLPEVKAGRWYFEQLFINGRRAVRARSPQTGYYYVDIKGGRGVDPKTGKMVDLSRRNFHALHDADIQDFAALSGNALNDVTLTVLWDNWISTKLRVAAVDPASRLITLTGAPGKSSHCDFDRGVRYFVENCRSALDAPGEWFLDRSGTLFYQPLPGEDVPAAKVFAPRLDQFMVIAGDPQAGKFVEHVTFQGLSFQHAECLTPPEGMPEQQSAVTVPAAIIADGAHDVRFDNCEIAHIGGYALHLRTGCENCAVTHCHLHDLGAGGIHLGGVNAPADWEQSSHLVVANNIIQSGGRVHPSGSAILSHHCSDSSITHNDIADFNYIAISVGWNWNYGLSRAKRNQIDFNRIGWIGQNTLSDLAGIYTLGESQGTEIVGNVIHDVSCYRYGAFGIYSDQASTGIRIANNLTCRTGISAYNMNWGKDVVIENNIFSLTGVHGLTKGTGHEESSAIFRRNIVWIDRGDILAEGWSRPEMQTSHNLYWDNSGREVAFFKMPLAKWQAQGRDEGSIIADPLFENPQQLNFKLKEGSPAAKIGFVPFDFSQAGVIGDAAWRDLATHFTPPPSPPISPVPELTPLTLNEDFESTPINTPPGIAKIDPTWSWDKYGLLVAVVNESSPSGQRCLKMVKEKPGLPSWAPMLLYSPEHRLGRTRLSFDTKLQRDGQLLVNLEDRSSMGQAPLGGPRLTFKQGKLLVPGLKPIEIPWDQWIHVELEVGVGEQSNGTFDLTVTPPGGAAQRYSGIKYRSAQWSYLQWLAFNSLGEGNSTIYLDNIRLTNTRTP